MLPKHGKINCRKCYKNISGSKRKPHKYWQMTNDPGASGSREPEYLVLGFSKGSTQADLYKTGKLEDVAFAGMRERLTKALQVIGVLGKNESVTEKIMNPKGNFAFGSLIRCSVARFDSKASQAKGKPVYSCTGSLIQKSFKEIPHIIENCSTKFLTSLPYSVKAVFFLGNSDGYVKSCQKLIESKFPEDFKRINAMAVKADNRLWIHLAHPSGLNGHFNTWLKSASGPGLKRKLALAAMKVK